MFQRLQRHLSDGAVTEKAVRLGVLGALGLSGLTILGAVLFPHHLSDWASAILLAGASVLAYSLVLSSDWEVRVIRHIPDAKEPFVKGLILFGCGISAQACNGVLGTFAGFCYQAAGAMLVIQEYQKGLDNKDGVVRVSQGWLEGAVDRHTASTSQRDYVKFNEIKPDDIDVANSQEDVSV